MKRALLLIFLALAGCGSQIHTTSTQAIAVAAPVSSTTITSEPTTVPPTTVAPVVSPPTTTPPVDLRPLWNSLLAANPECNAGTTPALGVISIDKVGLDTVFVAGDGSKSENQLLCGPVMNLGPESGVEYLAGHHKTHTRPFENIWQLSPGDQIRLTAPNGSVTTYIVDRLQTPGFDPAELQRIYVAYRAEVGQGLMLSSCSPEPGDDPNTVSGTHRTVVLAHKEA